MFEFDPATDCGVIARLNFHMMFCQESTKNGKFIVICDLCLHWVPLMTNVGNGMIQFHDENP
jgi:hypothetical protein